MLEPKPTTVRRGILPALLLALCAVPAAAGTWTDDGVDAGFLGPGGRLYSPDLEARAEGPSACLLVLRATTGNSRLMRVGVDAETTVVFPIPGRDPATGLRDATPDGVGGAFVTWLDYRAGPTHWGQVYAQHITAAGTVAAGWPDSGLAVGAPDVQSDRPRIVRAKDGSAFVAWDQITTGPVEVAVRGVLPTGAVIGAMPLVAVVSAGAQRLGDLRPHPLGGIVVVLEDVLDGNTAIRAQRVGAGLERLWGSPGVGVAVLAGWRGDPVALVAPGGSACFAWRDSRDGSTFAPRSDIYVLGVLADGAPAPGFPVNGTLVRPGANRSDARLAAEGGGGVYVSSIEPGDGRVDRVSASGVVDTSWSSFKSPVGYPGLSNHGHVNDVVEDGAGGLFLAWSTGASAAVQRLAADGSPAAGWPAGGRSFDAGGSSIGRVSLAPGGGQGVAWLAYEAIHPLTCPPGEVCYEKRAWVTRLPEVTTVDAPGPAVSASVLALGAPRPNPVVAGSAWSIAFELPVAGPVRVEVLDVAGRRRLVRRLSHLAAGPHVLAVGGEEGLSPGAYHVRVVGPSAEAVTRLSVVR